MDDNKIIELYQLKDENAISESENKYGRFCYSIAFNILQRHEDSEECVSDTWLRTWNSIPPEKPNSLKAYFSRITRNLALDRYRSKQHKTEMMTALDELGECVTNGISTEDEYLAKELGECINRFLMTLTERDRDIFIARYYFVYSSKQIARSLGLRENYVRNILSRTRQKLREHLTKEGYGI